MNLPHHWTLHLGKTALMAAALTAFAAFNAPPSRADHNSNCQVRLAKALIVFPGGFGTLDELMEMLTLMQTRKLAEHNIILIYGQKYWNRVLNWKAMVQSGTINEREFKMLQFADTVDEAFDHIRTGLEKYHMKVDSFLQS